MRNRLVRFILAAVVLLALAAAVLWWQLSRRITDDPERFVYVPRGSSVVSAVDTIDAQCSLPSASLVSLSARVLARLSGRTIQSGWYVFTNTSTQLDVLKALFSGHLRPARRVTIPEGLHIREIGGIVARALDIDSASFVDIAERDSVQRSFGVEGTSMEGYLKPDTYEFFWREDAAVVVTRMAREFQSMWNRECEGLLASSGRTKHEIVTLASIVQAEAATTSEMPRIAGVYANRLSRGMRLEADPTVQYGLGQRRRLLYRDLDDASRYNTYVVEGLPPGPINNPGLEALRAALRPEEHDYLFFVARGDGSGLHTFARNGQEHLLNVRRYRRNRSLAPRP